MHEVLNRNTFLLRHPLRFFDTYRNDYDIYDKETAQLVMKSSERLVKILGVSLRGGAGRIGAPFNITVSTPEGEQVIRVKRHFAIFRSIIYIFDENDQLVGGFRPYSFPTVAHFNVLDVNDKVVFRVKRKWFGSKMLFIAGRVELARLKRVWKGLFSHLKRTSDDYVLQISESVASDNPVRQLILAVVVCLRGISTNMFYT